MFYYILINYVFLVGVINKQIVKMNKSNNNNSTITLKNATLAKLLTIFLCFFMINCSNEDCPQDINKLPMYGNKKKCKEQVQYDLIFIKETDKIFPNRSKAAIYYIKRGWDYFYKNELDTAMMRFNQAWLLDSLNPDIYWGFGNLLGQQQKYKESLVYFEKSLKKNPNNSKVWESASTSLGNLFIKTNDVAFLNKTIDYLKQSLFIEPKNARVLGQLTSAYSYFIEKDSALLYLNKTDEIDSKMVNPEVRKMLTNK